MDETITATGLPPAFPDHTQLPDEDGTFVKNFQEHPQSIILTDSIGPVVERLHPDGQYAIGQDCGIYWRETDPPERGAEAPDWFYVPNVPATLDGFRRSYVLWREHMAPFIALEFASGNGEEERDRTPLSVAADGTTTKPGKFWVYERIIRIPYYGIYEMRTGNLEVYHLIDFDVSKDGAKRTRSLSHSCTRCRIGAVAGKLSKSRTSLAAVVGFAGEFAVNWLRTS